MRFQRWGWTCWIPSQLSPDWFWKPETPASATTCSLSCRAATPTTPPTAKTVTAVYVCVQWLSHVWVCGPMDCSPPGSSVTGVSQARLLEWVAVQKESLLSDGWTPVSLLSISQALYSPSSLVSWELSLPPFCRWGSWGPGRLWLTQGHTTSSLSLSLAPSLFPSLQTLTHELNIWTKQAYRWPLRSPWDAGRENLV